MSFPAYSGSRLEKGEFCLAPGWFASERLNFGSGARVDIENDMSWRIGFGYNFTKNFELSGDFGWASPDYTITAPRDTNGDQIPDDVIKYSTEADIWDGHLNGTFNFLQGPLTPFVTAGLGYTWIDSNIPSGTPTTGCWWDPWYGYICSTWQDTHDETFFSYKVGLGVRWDVNDDFYLKASYARTWVDFDNASGSPFFESGSIDFGFMY